MIARAVALVFALLVAAGVRAEETSATLRIVTCAPSLAEYAFAVGAGPDVVAVSRYTTWPPEAAALPAVTDLFTPSLEAIVAVKPTLILTIPSNTAVREFFARRPGVRVVDTGEVESFADVARALEIVGEATGRAAQGKAAAAALRARLAEARATRPSPRPVLLVLGGSEADPAAVTAAGKGTYLSELADLAGGENILDESHGLYPRLSRENLLRLDPEVILFLGEDEPTPDAVAKLRAQWAPLRALRAVRDPEGLQVVAVPGLFIPGPRALDGLPRLRAAVAKGS
jgi:iron complex transport system substrate-binding protein